MKTTLEALITARDEASKKFKQVSKNASKAMKGAKNQIKQTGKEMQGFFDRFHMEFLSIMFAGMALQRAFGGLMKEGTDTFKKLMESADMYNTTLHGLSAGFTYLKFMIGRAFEELLGPHREKIMTFFNDIGDWISSHPQFVAGLIAITTALGAVMMVGSMVLLFINGLKIALMNLGASHVITAIQPLLGILWQLALLALLIWALWKLNIGSFQEMWGQVSEDTEKAVSSIWENVKEQFKSTWDFLKAAWDGDLEAMKKSLSRFSEASKKIMIYFLAWFMATAQNVAMWFHKAFEDSLGLVAEAFLRLSLTIGKIFTATLKNFIDNFIGGMIMAWNWLMVKMGKTDWVIRGWTEDLKEFVGIAETLGQSWADSLVGDIALARAQTPDYVSSDDMLGVLAGMGIVLPEDAIPAGTAGETEGTGNTSYTTINNNNTIYMSIPENFGSNTLHDLLNLETDFNVYLTNTGGS